VLGGLAWLDAGKPEDAAKLVEPLTGDGQPYRFSALEIQAQAALAAGDKAKAKTIYEQLKQLGALAVGAARRQGPGRDHARTAAGLTIVTFRCLLRSNAAQPWRRVFWLWA
jgi:hypothetical protein